MKKEKFVRLTKKLIEEIFNECNEKYFNNEVSKPKFFEVWTPWKRTLGMVRPIYNKKTETYSSALHISKLYNWTMENLRKVIVHEMIHLYISDYLQPLRWWENLFPFLCKEHNNEFKEIMTFLNENYNLDIKIKFPEMKKYFKIK